MLLKANKFQFNGQTLGLQPNGDIRVIMTLFDPFMWYEVEDYVDVQSTADIYTQLLSHLIQLMDKLQPDTNHISDHVS